MRRSRLEAALALALALALAGAGSADARVFQMSGQWTPRRVSGTELPLNPGFVPGMGLVSATGSAPARLTLKPGRFAEEAPGVVLPLAGQTLVQLSTMLDAMGPQESAMFGPGPKASRPASFVWAVPVGGAPTNDATVSYSAGPNQFGGTARMLLAGGGSVSLTVGPSAILHGPFGFGSAVGAGYAAMASVMLPPGDITQQIPLPTGVVTMPGAVIGMGVADTLVSTGFPWTTGQVRVFVPAQSSSDTPSAVTLTGLDARTPLGAGNIVLVAGGLVRRSVADQFSAHVDVLDLTLAPLEVPSLSRAGVAAAVFVLLAAGYWLRRRR